MSKKCKSCGAPLGHSSEQNEVECMYCGTINTYNYLNPGKVITEFFSHKPRVVKQKNKSGLVAFIFLVTLIIPAIVLLYNFTSVFGNVYWHSGCQFINYNNDDALDIVGFSRIHANTQILTVIDGGSGEVLEKKDIQKIGTLKNLYCLNYRYIITTSPEEICVYNKNDLSSQYTFEYIGAIQGFNLQGEVLCFNIWDSGDYYSLGVDLINGKEAACEGKSFDLPKYANYDNFYTEPETNIKYEAKYSHKTKTVITSVKNNKKLWERTISDLKIENSGSFQYTPKTIVIFGKKKSEKNKVFIVGIDNETGKVKYETSKEGQAVFLSDVFFNNRYIICYWSSGLEAYNPETGESVWEL